MTVDIDSEYDIAFDEEDGAKIAFDFHGVDRPLVVGREAVDLVGAQPRIERIGLENLELPARRVLLAVGELGGSIR